MISVLWSIILGISVFVGVCVVSVVTGMILAILSEDEKFPRGVIRGLGVLSILVIFWFIGHSVRFGW